MKDKIMKLLLDREMAICAYRGQWKPGGRIVFLASFIVDWIRFNQSR